MQKIISLIMIWVMLFSLVGCAADESKNPSAIDTDGRNGGALVVNGVEVKDAFVTLHVDTLEENEVSVEEIKVEDIIVNCVSVEGINVLEVEVVPLSDEFVYLAYQNFVSYYGENIDFQKFLTDIAIGGTCILVYVTLSMVGGPVASFFGAVISSEFTTASVAIGAAIDAAVSGYQAYQEGGDAAYIVGHMLNGVADGVKWSAMLAPVSGSFSGIQTVRAINAIKKLEGFADKSDKAIEAVLKDYSKIIKSVKEADLSDAALKKLYKKMSGELSEETTEDVFILAVRNQADITDCVLKYRPFNVDITDEEAKMLRAAATRKQQIQWLLDDGIPENKLTEIKKKITKAKTWKDIEDIEVIDNNNVTRKIFIKNGKTDSKKRLEFLQLFGDKLPNKVIDDFLRTKWKDDEIANAIKKCITKSDAYSKLHEEIGYYNCVHLLSDPESLIVLKVRFGSKYVDRLLEFRRWHQCIDKEYINHRIKKRQNAPKSKKEVELNVVEEIVEGIRRGRYKTIDDVKKNVSKVAGDNLIASKNAVSKLLKESGSPDKNMDFLKDLAYRSLKEQVKVDENLYEALVENRISKNEIIEKYGQEAYNELVKKFNQVVQCLTLQNTVDNFVLIKELFADVLRKEGVAEDVINKILNGTPVSMWGISNSEVEEIAHQVAIYYLKTDSKCFSNFIDAVTAKTVQDGKLPQEAVEQIKRIMENGGIPSDGYIGAGVFSNKDNKDEIILKGEVNCKEYDIYPDIDPNGRGEHRLVFGESGHVYYTDKHYLRSSFKKII